MRKDDHVLVAIAGSADMFALNKYNPDNPGTWGPIAAAAKSPKYEFFNEICVINTNSGLFPQQDIMGDNGRLEKASFETYVKWLSDRVSPTPVKPYYFTKCENINVTEYLFLHKEIGQILLEISNRKNEEDKNVFWYIQTSAGPNQAQFVWPLLTQKLNVKFIKSEPNGAVYPQKLPFKVYYDVITDDAKDSVVRSGAYILEYSCEKMQKLVAYLDKIAPLPGSVLLEGETGTGKEMLARRIHEKSGRPGSFRAVNCATLPDTLLESLLFGHVKGAFTGATQDRTGIIEQANLGTLFLDEIGEMPILQQSKLLRVLEEKKIEKLGATKEKDISHVDFRVIAATNRNLYEEISENRFREDLFYRIALFHQVIPSLYERDIQDIDKIADYHLKEAEKEIRGANKISGNDLIPEGESFKLSTEARLLLHSHTWPGNARELANVVKRAASHCMLRMDDYIVSRDDVENSMYKKKKVMSSATDMADDLDIDPGKRINIIKILSAIEDKYCDVYYKACGKKKKAAELLGYPNYQTMQNRWDKARSILS